MLSTSTDATSVSRDSSNTDGSSTSSIRTHSVTLNNAVVIPTKSNKDKNLHGQIEDLLMALSEMQRDHAILATQLQKEREEREEDRNAVRSLLDGLRKKTSSETLKSAGSDETCENVKPVKSDVDEDVVGGGDETTVPEHISMEEDTLAPPEEVTVTDLSALLDIVEERFSAPLNNRRSSMLQSKSQLREELARSKEQLIIEVSKSQDFSRRLSEQQQEIQNLRDQVKETHTHIRNTHQEKQRLEKQIHDLRAKSAASTPDGTQHNDASEWPTRSSAPGLRELKLGRTNSGRSQAGTFNKRTSSLNTNASVNTKENENPNSSAEQSPTKRKEEVDTDALVLELVQAKTAEAIAKQEAEEAKSKLEGLRKMLGMGSGESPSGHRSSPSVPVIGNPLERSMTLSAVATSSGFWGGWGKRSTSGEKVGGA